MFRPMTLLAFALVAGVAAAAAPQAALPEWKPDAAVLARLGPMKDAGPFRIRPPKGYQLSRQPGPPGTEVFGWVGAERADGSRPYVMVMAVSPPPGKKNPYNAEQALDRTFSSLKEQRADWKRTDTEQGTVNGMTFARASWTGTEPQRKAKMRGFAYVTIDGERVIQINSQDVEPHAEQALKLAEAAALTFRKK